MNASLLEPLGILRKTDQHILFTSHEPMQTTGSSVWNGGSAQVNGWLNLKVNGDTHISESPTATLQHYARQLQIESPLAGMMTAASMNSLRYAVRGNAEVTVACIVTAGIQNARRAGDPCEDETQDTAVTHQPRFGTINIALISNAGFSPAARIEALMLATEAKTAACYDLNIASPVSRKTATGTGTDAICLLSGIHSRELAYCGKHTQMGEWIGSATYAAVLESLQACVSLRQRSG